MINTVGKNFGRKRIVAGLLGLSVLVSGALFVPRLMQPDAEVEQSAQAGPVDIGITYLPLTPGVAAYYNLGADCGALVTEVVPNSIADQAGIRTGDIIVTLNGEDVEKESSLLGVLRNCPADVDIVMEICRGEDVQSVRLVRGGN